MVCFLSMFCFQAADERPPSEGDNSDVRSVGTDEGSVGAADESDVNDEDSEAGDHDDDDDEFVDAGDEVEDVVDQAPWVTERRHSGDGEVQFPSDSIF